MQTENERVKVCVRFRPLERPGEGVTGLEDCHKKAWVLDEKHIYHANACSFSHLPEEGEEVPFFLLDDGSTMSSPGSLVSPRLTSPKAAAQSHHACTADACYNPAFTFDHVFGEEDPTYDIYCAVGRDVVLSGTNGWNGTIFAYGQTNSGKTFTIKGTSEHWGVIPLAIHETFRELKKQQTETENEIFVHASYIQIYNEGLYDLLNPEATDLKIRQHAQRGVFVEGATRELVLSPEETFSLLERGEVNREVASTKMNDQSSRSHTVFRLEIESVSRTKLQTSCINFVDLAGSERHSRTGSEGKVLKEGAYINKSLLTLGQVISKLSSSKDKDPNVHIPYRDSKLTRMLETSLGGNSRTSIICTASISIANLEETASTLHFANRAKRVQNKPKHNEVEDEVLLKEVYLEAMKALRRKSHKFDALPPEVLKLLNLSPQDSPTQAVDGEKVLELQSRLIQSNKARLDGDALVRDLVAENKKLRHLARLDRELNGTDSVQSARVPFHGTLRRSSSEVHLNRCGEEDKEAHVWVHDQDDPANSEQVQEVMNENRKLRRHVEALLFMLGEMDSNNGGGDSKGDPNGLNGVSSSSIGGDMTPRTRRRVLSVKLDWGQFDGLDAEALMSKLKKKVEELSSSEKQQRWQLAELKSDTEELQVKASRVEELEEKVAAITLELGDAHRGGEDVEKQLAEAMKKIASLRGQLDQAQVRNTAQKKRLREVIERGRLLEETIWNGRVNDSPSPSSRGSMATPRGARLSESPQSTSIDDDLVDLDLETCNRVLLSKVGELESELREKKLLLDGLEEGGSSDRWRESVDGERPKLWKRVISAVRGRDRGDSHTPPPAQPPSLERRVSRGTM